MTGSLSPHAALRYHFKGALQCFNTVAQTPDAKACSAARVRVIVFEKSRTAVAHGDYDRLCIRPNLDTLFYGFAASCDTFTRVSQAKSEGIMLAR